METVKTSCFIANLKMVTERNEYAEAIGGLPLDHKEVFEKRGWLLPYLFSYDSFLWGRWDYWFKILEKKTTLESGPIPQIEFSSANDEGVIQTFKMLRNCLNHQEATISNFADWLLWGFSKIEKLNVSKSLNKHYYKNFEISLLQENPYDYFSILLEEYSTKEAKTIKGYFSTPSEVSILNTKLLNKKEQKDKVIYDPTIGCGALLLPLSNYHLKAYGQDVNKIALKVCLIQFMLYAPWFAFHPDDIELI